MVTQAEEDYFEQGMYEDEIDDVKEDDDGDY